MGIPPPELTLAPTKKQVAVSWAPLGRLERKITRPIADHTVDGSAIGPISLLDIERRPEILDDDMLAQIGEPHSLQFVDAELLKCNTVLARVRVLLVDVRNVRKDFDVVAAGRGLGRIRSRGRNQVSPDDPHLPNCHSLFVTGTGR